MNDLLENELITVEELCQMLMIGKNMAYKLLNAGEIPCFKISREWKIPWKSVYEYIQHQCGINRNKNGVQA